MKESLPINELKLITIIKQIEAKGPLGKQSLLWEAVAKAYDKAYGVKASPSLFYQRVREWKIKVKTPPGKRGRPAGSKNDVKSNPAPRVSTSPSPAPQPTLPKVISTGAQSVRHVSLPEYGMAIVSVRVPAGKPVVELHKPYDQTNLYRWCEACYIEGYRTGQKYTAEALHYWLSMYYIERIDSKQFKEACSIINRWFCVEDTLDD